MKTNRFLFAPLLAALLACFLPPAFAEDLAPPGAPPAGPAEGVRIFHRGHQGQAPKNAPYSAQAVSERLQQLPDGNQIEQRTGAASYRDSAGRTRHEVRGADGEVRVVMINDPVANMAWALTPATRTAQQLPSRADVVRRAGAAARARIEQLRKEGHLPALERGASAGEGAAILVERERGSATDNAGGKDGRRETVRVLRMQDGPGLAGLAPHFGPMIANAAGDMKWAAKAVSRDLGTREFNGVRAEGKLRSYEIPAGEVGNRNPIVVANENWYAPELQVTVYSKHSDPRSGEYIYRLEGLKRGEPDPALFTVPSDYKVREARTREPRLPGKNAE